MPAGRGPAAMSRPRPFSPDPLPRLAHAEKAEKRLHDAAVRAHLHFIDSETTQQVLSLLALLVHRPVIRLADAGIARVDVDRLTRLGVHESRQPDVREL